jgi:hypothetical protein
MKNLKLCFKVTLAAMLFCLTTNQAQSKDDSDKESKSNRPGFFKELVNTQIICMETCPKKVDSLFGIKVICGNFEKALFDSSCEQASGHTPVEYCNCDESLCAKFSVECSADGTACEVKMSSLGIQPSECRCNNNTCVSTGTGFAKASCFMRKETESGSCDIHRMVGFSDGRSYHIACDDDNAACVSEGMKISDSIQVEKLPTKTKPGDLK